MLRLCLYLNLLTLLAGWTVAAQGIISTVAGSIGYIDNAPAIDVRLEGPQSVAVDKSGAVFIGTVGRIRRVDPLTGRISTVAGIGNRYQLIDGPALQISLEAPRHLTFDPQGNLYFIDSRRVMKLDFQTGRVVTIAGAVGSITPQFGLIEALALDRQGNLFISDSYYQKIYRRDAATGTVETYAGSGGYAGPGPSTGDGGPATLAPLFQPSRIAVDASGNLYIADRGWLRRVDAKTRIITSIMPVNEVGANDSGTGDGGPVAKATLRNVSGLAVNAAGDLFLADGPRVRKITWGTATIATVAGSGKTRYDVDGVPALQANLAPGGALTFDARDNLYLADIQNSRVFAISSDTGLIRTVAGTSANGDGGPATSAQISAPVGLAVGPDGDLYISAGSIRRVDRRTGRISSVPLTNQDNAIQSIAVGPDGTIFFVNQYEIKRTDATLGSVTIPLNLTTGQHLIAVDKQGNLYIADSFGYQIKRLDAQTGSLQTIAGNGQMQPFTGEPGPATQVSIGAPGLMTFAPDGDLYWGTSYGRILRLNKNGTISAVAGTGGCAYSGDGGPAALAGLCGVTGLAFDAAGNLFVSEGICACVRRIAADTGIIQTVAGTGTRGISEDGIPATKAALSGGRIAMAGDTLYIADVIESSLARIRAVTPPIPPAMPLPPSISEVVNAVDFRAALSPGALVSVFGNYLAPATPMLGEVGGNGRYLNSIGGSQFSVRDVPAPILYTSAGQINAVIPFGTAPGRVPVQVTTGAGAARMDLFPVQPVSPSLFEDLVFNPDGTRNGPSNPAPKGATLVMYGTGMGQTSPPSVDGAVSTGSPLPVPLARFSAFVVAPPVGVPAEVLYFGPLPGFVAGAVQANVRIPDSVPPGKAILSLSSSSGSTVPQPIYMLSDPPVITGISPASPVPQSPTTGTSLRLTGRNFNQIVDFNFYFNGSRFAARQSGNCATATLCTLSLDLAGRAGEYAVEVVNVANQVSNRWPFTMAPYSPPTITAITPASGAGPIRALNGRQALHIVGDGFLAPLTVDIFYNGNRIAVLSSTDSPPILADRSDVIYPYFDFQGRAGIYGFEVASSANGRSARFNLTVAAP